MAEQTIAEKICAARKAAGLTQRQLGLAIGLSEATASRTVQKWEYGEREPRIAYIRPLAEALQVSIDYLVP